MLTAVRTCCVAAKVAGYKVPSVDEATIYVIIRLSVLAGGLSYCASLSWYLTVGYCKTDACLKISAAADTAFRWTGLYGKYTYLLIYSMVQSPS